MRKIKRNPMTLTEAQLLTDVHVLLLTGNTTQSTARTIPYAELYRGRASIMETPVQHLQKAAEDEERRKSVG